MKIREFFNRQMRNMFLQYRYGETVDSVQQIKNSVSVQHDDIVLIEDVPNWQQKRGIYPCVSFNFSEFAVAMYLADYTTYLRITRNSP